MDRYPGKVRSILYESIIPYSFNSLVLLIFSAWSSTLSSASFSETNFSPKDSWRKHCNACMTTTCWEWLSWKKKEKGTVDYCYYFNCYIENIFTLRDEQQNSIEWFYKCSLLFQVFFSWIAISFFIFSTSFSIKIRDSGFSFSRNLFQTWKCYSVSPLLLLGLLYEVKSFQR